MKRVWNICWNDLLLIIRDKMFLLWTLVLPVFFIFIFVKAFGGMGQKEKTVLWVFNQDQGEWGERFLSGIKHPDLDVRRIDRVEAGGEKVLIIPVDFSRKIDSKTVQKLELRTREGANIQAAAQVEMSIIQGLVRVLAEVVVNSDDSVPGIGHAKEFRELVELRTAFPPNTIDRIPSGVDHQVPGTLVHFLLMNILIAGGITFSLEGQNGTLTRLLFSSLTVPGVWLGKFMGRMLVALLQSLLLIASGALLFGFSLGNVAHLIFIIFFFSISVTALSLFLGSLVTKEDMLVGLAILIGNLMAAFGGCWWPIEIVGKPFRLIGMTFPSYWAMDGFHKILFFHVPFSELILNAAVLLGFTLLFSFLSFPKFKIKN